MLASCNSHTACAQIAKWIQWIQAMSCSATSGPWSVWKTTPAQWNQIPLGNGLRKLEKYLWQSPGISNWVGPGRAPSVGLELSFLRSCRSAQQFPADFLKFMWLTRYSTSHQAWFLPPMDMVYKSFKCEFRWISGRIWEWFVVGFTTLWEATGFIHLYPLPGKFWIHPIFRTGRNKVI